MQLELSNGLTRVHLDSLAAGPSVDQTARVGLWRVAARKILSKPTPPISICLRVDPWITCIKTTYSSQNIFKTIHVLSQNMNVY